MAAERQLLDWNTSEIIRETIWAEIKSREKWEDTQGPKYKYNNPYDLRGKVRCHAERISHSVQATVSLWCAGVTHIDRSLDHSEDQSVTARIDCPLRGLVGLRSAI